MMVDGGDQVRRKAGRLSYNKTPPAHRSKRKLASFEVTINRGDPRPKEEA